MACYGDSFTFFFFTFTFTLLCEDECSSGGVTSAFLTLAQDGSVVYMPRLRYLQERALGSHWTGGWVDPRVGLDIVQ
jgi:hypothetical protein